MQLTGNKALDLIIPVYSIGYTVSLKHTSDEMPGVCYADRSRRLCAGHDRRGDAVPVQRVATGHGTDRRCLGRCQQNLGQDLQ